VIENSIIQKITTELGLKQSQILNTVTLLDEGGTIPFISRYRKEMTGSLDEVEITSIRDRLSQLRDLGKRRTAILKSISDQGKLTIDLKKQIDNTETLSDLEDIYLPFKPKRKTRATMAREKGLEPLALRLFNQEEFDVSHSAMTFINSEKGVDDVEAAFQGARDIMAEWISEDQKVRKDLRDLFLRESTIKSKIISSKKEDAEKYKDYFDWEEQFRKVPSHRILAMRRGENEGFLTIDIKPDEVEAIGRIEKNIIRKANSASLQVEEAIKDSYKRLLKPSMETEARLISKKRADEEAINVFAENLRVLLLAPPLGQKTVLALDPGFRTGCKVVVLDKQGKLLQNETIFPNQPQNRQQEAGAILKELLDKYKVEAIAIGNGTASRETESFVKGIGISQNIIVEIVNESGASIYSASEVARNEFPDKDVTVRGSVSIGRRLMDPLAELVKIDPKSIGVGQYQHDVDQSLLRGSLDDVVMNCVNSVGVEVNTSSAELLAYVSGLGPQLARTIVEFRNEKGPFKNRSELKQVPRLGDKAFEHSAGFLRIKDSKNPLDYSSVHPESYHIVEKMASDLNTTIENLILDKALRTKVRLQDYITDEVGLPTLQDIMTELEKPGRDPRKGFEVFAFEDGINEMEDLKVGMQLPGIVTNVTNFGAFIDVGVHQDGLVHISQLSDGFVKDPKKIVKVNNKVSVTVTALDISRKRISLSMKSDPFSERNESKKVRKKVIDKEDINTGIQQLKRKFNKDEN
jgi:uncharacterized protein